MTPSVTSFRACIALLFASRSAVGFTFGHIERLATKLDSDTNPFADIAEFAHSKFDELLHGVQDVPDEDFKAMLEASDPFMLTTPDEVEATNFMRNSLDAKAWESLDAGQKTKLRLPRFVHGAAANLDQFTLAPVGSNVCPGNYTPIMSAAFCSDAVNNGLDGIVEDTSLGTHTFQSSTDPTSEDYPSGCYKHMANNDIYFNSINDTTYTTFVAGATEDRKICTLYSEYCEVQHQLRLSKANVLTNNLGNRGPISGPTADLTFGNVFPSRMATVVDLRISVLLASGSRYTDTSSPQDAYEPGNSSRNGVYATNGDFGFGNINLKANTSTTLRFRFVYAGSDNLVDESDLGTDYFLSFFDLDQGNQQMETAQMLKYKPHVEHTGAGVKIINEVIYGSQTHGTQLDNPGDVCHMKPKALRNHVVIKMPPHAMFDVKLAVGHGWPETGRNIMFGGVSPVVCPVNPFCGGG